MASLPHRNPTVILMDYTNWAKWFQQLKAQCAAYQVWPKIDPKQAESPLEKPSPPIAPAIGSYQASTTAINQYVLLYRQVHGKDAIVPNYEPARPSDLSANGKTTYKDDIKWYKTKLEEYKILNQNYQLEQTGLGKATEYLRTTVSAHLFYNCCSADQPHRQWINILAATVGINDKDEQKRVRERYLAAFTPMRTLAQWNPWLTEVDYSITEGRALGILECQDEEFVKQDFVKATLTPALEWTILFMGYRVNDLRISVKDMIKQFRDVATLSHPITTTAAFVADELKQGKKKSKTTSKDPQRCKACDRQH